MGSGETVDLHCYTGNEIDRCGLQSKSRVSSTIDGVLCRFCSLQRSGCCTNARPRPVLSTIEPE